MKILLTGFNPFGGLEANPSQLIVEAIDTQPQPFPDVQLITEVLPTEFDAAGKRIRALLRQHRPDAVICTGVARTRVEINLERLARNWDESVLPDNRGRLVSGKKIAARGHESYSSTLPLERMKTALEARGIPVVLSDSAGSYVCNHVFYVACRELAHMRSSALCGFIHVPPLANQPDSPGLPLDVMVEAIACCVAEVAALNR